MSISEDHKVIAKVIVHYALDYVRWTQLVPMILGWAFAIVMVLALFLIGFQGEIDALLSRADSTIENWIGVEPETNQHEADSSGTVTITEDSFVTWVYRIWGVLALAGWLYSNIRTKLFGPKAPTRWKRKIYRAVMASLLFVGFLMLGTLVIGGVSGNTHWELMVPFILLPLLLFVVSFWGISVSHLITKIQRDIGKRDSNEHIHKVTA
ncbi:MAG: hypothetical protein EA391_07740 [Balneolaceae bacterium]|nr:MAG: hypothetical protein EA391_07740 [Balneolaceae bacterium]